MWSSGGFPRGSAVKKPPSTYSAGDPGDTGSISGSRRSPGGRHGNLLHYSCLEESQWTEESGRLQSIWLQKAGHTWSNWAHTCDLLKHTMRQRNQLNFTQGCRTLNPHIGSCSSLSSRVAHPRFSETAVPKEVVVGKNRSHSACFLLSLRR